MTQIPEYTLVVGVDHYHLEQLALTWPTWKKCKPSLLDVPMIVFFDYKQVSSERVQRVVDHPNLQTIPWPIRGLQYVGKRKDSSKWNNAQRSMMISGFVYIPALFVKTNYWLKLDTDVVATGQNDWIDPKWFDNNPAIVAHRWSFTKPADQLVRLDQWVEKNVTNIPMTITTKDPLNIVPELGSERVGHKRIISWCGFFDTFWTYLMAKTTEVRPGKFRMPVPSQDGFLWYMATRQGREVLRVNMKQLGWEHWSAQSNVERRSREVMEQ